MEIGHLLTGFPQDRVANQVNVKIAQHDPRENNKDKVDEDSDVYPEIDCVFFMILCFFLFKDEDSTLLSRVDESFSFNFLNQLGLRSTGLFKGQGSSRL